MLKEENYWRQRSKTYWLRDGDRNTKYFHAVASRRKCLNLVKKLRKEDNTYAENQEDLSYVAKQYFNVLFQNLPGNNDEALDSLRLCIVEEDNIALLAPFREEEFISALFEMHPDKVRDPDGLNPSFYIGATQYMKICGNDISKFAMN